MSEIPRIISVDDHLLEPPDLFDRWLPRKYKDRAPKVVRSGIRGDFWTEMAMDPEGRPTDWWIYEDMQFPLCRNLAASGFPRDEMGMEGITFDEMRPGCYDPKARIADMDLNWVEASMSFPGGFPRFCGQGFLERHDKELALACVHAYNDFMVEEWCGDSGGRLIPLIVIPLWDSELAAAEIRRNAARGVHAVCFSELPTRLGLPSIFSGHWDPFLAACDETRTVINMHIGSSSTSPTTSPDAPVAVNATLLFNNAMASMTDWLFSGKFAQFPNLTLAYSEGQIGWIPYLLERVDDVWFQHRAQGGFGGRRLELVTEPPSTFFPGHIYGCFFRDRHGLRSLDEIGVDNVTFETDYPHVDSSWPESKEVATKLLAGFDEEVQYKILRGNAIRMLSLDFDPDRTTS
jgi:predicted TIM-barrel fold metal-dependent hydrolase